jgi:hypothetical protein
VALPKSFAQTFQGAVTIKRNRNTHAKRQREADKKAKSDAKRSRRNQRKQEGVATGSPASLDAQHEQPNE